MGQTQTTQKCNFEDVQKAVLKNYNYILINTLDKNEQDCLIYSTLSYKEEERTINNLLKENNKIHIIIYGKNNNDETIYNKYKQLINLGFTNVYIYLGGLFEWLCLQDIFGDDEFPTTKKELDLLKYRGVSILTRKMLNY